MAVGEEDEWNWDEIAASVEEKEAQYMEKSQETSDPSIESFTKLKIKDRTISNEQIAVQMSGRKFWHIKELGPTAEEQLKSGNAEFVSIGVVMKKFQQKKNLKGTLQTTWVLSDMKNNTVNVFLCDEAFQSHWKEIEGAIIAIINPGVITSNTKGKFCFKCSKAEQIYKVGMAVDYARCRGQTKAGTRCSEGINRTDGELCAYHLERKFTKAASGRMELQGTGVMFKNSMLRHGGKNVSAGSKGATYLGTRLNVNPSGQIMPADFIPSRKPKQNSAIARIQSSAGISTDTNKKPTYGSRMIAQAMGQKVQPKAAPFTLKKLLSHQKTHNKENKPDLLGKLLRDGVKKSVSTSKKAFDGVVSVPPPSTVFSKGTAAPMISEARSYFDEEPDSELNAKQVRLEQKRLAERLKNGTVSSRTRIEAKIGNKKLPPTNPKKRQSTADAFCDLFGGKHIKVDSIAAEHVLSKKSKHADVAANDDAEKIDQTLGGLQEKDLAADLMSKKTKVTVSAFACTTCSYILEVPVSTCSTMGHDVSKVQVSKRFFKCVKCQQRTSVLKARIPTVPCRKCNGMDYVRCSMYREKKGPETRAVFQPTGGAQTHSLRFG